MFTEEILAKLREGAELEAICAEITASLNEAKEQHAAEQAAKEEQKNLETLARNLLKDYVALFDALGFDSTIFDEINEEDVLSLVATLMEAFR